MSEITNLDSISFFPANLIDLSVPDNSSTEEIVVVESEPIEDLEEAHDNPSDILSKYINIDVEPYKGTVVDAQDVVNLYNIRNNEWASKVGRKTTLTPEVFLKIIELKELYSFTDERIADAIGIHPENLRKWKNRGRLSKDDVRFDQYFAVFSWAYKRASTMMEKRLVGYVDTAAEVKWEAAKWLLSKTEQGRYGDFSRSEVDVKSENINTNVDVHISLTEKDKKSIMPMLEDFIKKPVVIDNDAS